MGLKDELIKKAAGEKTDEPEVQVKEEPEKLNLEADLSDILNQEEQQQETETVDFDSLLKEAKAEPVVEETVEEVASEPIAEPEPQPVFQPAPQPSPRAPQRPKQTSNSGLGDSLLALAKQVVMEDISTNFSSGLVTEDALHSLITAYLSDDNMPFANGNAILASVIDEVLSDGYANDHYTKLTSDILASVKTDLGF